MNVVSYFLIVLGGFGVVWGYRAVRYFGTNKPAISEFEYAAFSAIWGGFVFALAIQIWNTTGNSEVYSVIEQTPFVASPTLFVIGVAIGVLGCGVLFGLRYALAAINKRLSKL